MTKTINVKMSAQLIEKMAKMMAKEEITMTKEEIIAKYKEGNMEIDNDGFETWNPVSYGPVEKAIIGAWCFDSLPKYGKATKVTIWSKPRSWSAPMVEIEYKNGHKELSTDVGTPSDEEVLYGYYRACGMHAKARAIKKALKAAGEKYLPGTVKVVEDYI